MSFSAVELFQVGYLSKKARDHWWKKYKSRFIFY